MSTTLNVKTATESSALTTTHRTTTISSIRKKSHLTTTERNNKRKIGITRFRHKLYTYVNQDRPYPDLDGLKGDGRIISKIAKDFVQINNDDSFVFYNQITFSLLNRKG